MHGVHVRNERYAWAGILIALGLWVLSGCASPFLEKGQQALEHSQYRQAYEYFKKVPGSPKPGSELADGLAKATEGVGTQVLSQAKQAMARGERLGMPEGREYYLEALQKLDEAIRWYRLSVSYHDVFAPGSSNRVRSQIDHIRTLRARWQDRFEKAQRQFALQEARRLFNSGQFLEAIQNYTTALKFDWTDRPDLEKEIRRGLLTSRVQLIRSYLRQRRWREALSLLDLVSQSEQAELDRGLVENVRREYVSARAQYVLQMVDERKWGDAQRAVNELRNPTLFHAAPAAVNRALAAYRQAYGQSLLERGIQVFQEGDIDRACDLIQQAIDQGNPAAQEYKQRYLRYKELLVRALEEAKDEYERRLAESFGRISPEQACGIDEVQLVEFSSLVRGDKLEGWLDKQNINFPLIAEKVRMVLGKAYRLVPQAPARLNGNYVIEILEGNRWRVALEMWLQRDNETIFRAKGEETTDAYDIYSGFSIFRHINDNQAPILRSILNNLAKKVSERFIPFGKCRRELIRQAAYRFIQRSLSEQEAYQDLSVLRKLVDSQLAQE